MYSIKLSDDPVSSLSEVTIVYSQSRVGSIPRDSLMMKYSSCLNEILRIVINNAWLTTGFLTCYHTEEQALTRNHDSVWLLCNHCFEMNLVIYKTHSNSRKWYQTFAGGAYWSQQFGTFISFSQRSINFLWNVQIHKGYSR